MFGLSLMELVVIAVVLGVLMILAAGVVLVVMLVTRSNRKSLEGTPAMPGPRPVDFAKPPHGPGGSQ